MKKIHRFPLIFFGLFLLSACKPSTIPPTPPAELSVQSILLAGHTAGVNLLAWQPSGVLLASASASPEDTTIRLWDSNGNLIHTLSGHTGPILSLAWSPDGQWLASGSADQTVRLWNPNGSLKSILNVNQGNVWAVAWSPSGKLLATGSIVTYLNPTVQLWDSSGKPVLTLHTKYSGGKFYNLLWSPNGKYLLSGATDYAIWKPNGTQVAYIRGCASCTPAWGAAWSPDSSMYAIGDENGNVDIYNHKGQGMGRRQSDSGINSIAWSPDGKLLSAGRGVWKSDGTRLTAVTGSVNSVAWSPDGRYLAVAADNSIFIIRSSDGVHLLVLQDHTDTVNRLAWSPSASVLASASADRTIRLWRFP